MVNKTKRVKVLLMSKIMQKNDAYQTCCSMQSVEKRQRKKMRLKERAREERERFNDKMTEMYCE